MMLATRKLLGLDIYRLLLFPEWTVAHDAFAGHVRRHRHSPFSRGKGFEVWRCDLRCVPHLEIERAQRNQRQHRERKRQGRGAAMQGNNPSGCQQERKQPHVWRPPHHTARYDSRRKGRRGDEQRLSAAAVDTRGDASGMARSTQGRNG